MQQMQSQGQQDACTPAGHLLFIPGLVLFRNWVLNSSQFLHMASVVFILPQSMSDSLRASLVVTGKCCHLVLFRNWV